MSALPVVVSLLTHLGSPLLIGTTLGCILYGIFVGQTVWYFRSFLNDRIFFKLLVFVLLLLDGIQTGGFAAGAYQGYMHIRVLDLKLGRGLMAYVYCSTLTVLVVQSAFTYRIWIMSQHCQYITGLLAFLTVLRFAASLGFNVFVVLVDNAFTIHNPVSNGFGITDMASATACDIIMAIAMVCYLSKGRTEFPTRIQSLINKLIFYFVGIGALTSIFALLVLILWLALPHNLIFLIFHSVISKLYANSFLVTLNSRHSSQDEDSIEMIFISD